MISGFWIARKVYLSKGEKLQSVKNTYCKLIKIVMPAVLLMAILMKFNLLFHLDLGQYGVDVEHLSSYNTFNPNLFNIIEDVFLRTSLYKSNFVGPFAMNLQVRFLLVALPHVIIVGREIIILLFGSNLHGHLL